MIEFGAGVLVGAFALPWWFLGLFVLLVLADVGCSYADNYFAGTWVLVLGALGLGVVAWQMGYGNPFAWSAANWFDVGTYFVGYAVIGCLWSVAKWWLFLGKRLKSAEEEYQYNLEAHQKNPNHVDAPRRVRPRSSFASNNKGRLTGWIFHWPFSMLSVVIGDIIIKFADNLYKLLHGTFERMAAARFKGYESS